mgnify:FL=1
MLTPFQQEQQQQFNERDRQRVEAVLLGDQEAFTDLVNDHQRAVYNLTYRMLGDASEAEDAAQETFIRAYHHLASFDSFRSFKTWLLSIASHYCIDLIRKRRLSWLALDDLLPGQLLAVHDSPDVEDQLIKHESIESVHHLLERLKPDERAIIILRYWNDLSYEEIAETLNTNVGVIKSRLFRARQGLAARMRIHELGLQYAM